MDEALLGTLPRSKYRVEEREDGWYVFADDDPSFT